MTGEELRRYRKLLFSIRYWRWELEQMMRESYVKSPQMTGMPSGQSVTDPTSRRAMAEARLIEKVEKMLEEQEREAVKIMEWIQEINDPLVQVIMHLRYIKGKSWNAVAHLTNNSPESARQIHHRYLSQMSH